MANQSPVEISGNIIGSHSTRANPSNSQRLRRRSSANNRHLQEQQQTIDNNDNATNSTPPLTGVILEPTEVTPKFRFFVSFQWSLIMLPGDEDSSQPEPPATEIMSNWLLQDFLCNLNDGDLWMAKSLDLMKSDCSNIDNRATDFHTLLDTHSVILWNEPNVIWYSEPLEDNQNVQYEVWNVQYPLFSTGEGGTSDQNAAALYQMAQQKLQTMLEDRIRMGELQSDRGIPSIVGRELETYWLLRSNSQSPNLPPLDVLQEPPHAQQVPGTMGPYDANLVVIIGALIALIHTLLLVFLHLILRPYLLQRVEKEKQQKWAEEQQKQAEMTGKSEEDHMRSFLAPNYWLNGHPPQQPPPPTHITHKHRHVFVSGAAGAAGGPSSLSPQMPDDDLLSLSYLSALDDNNSSSKRSYFSAEAAAEEDIEVVSLLSSANSQDHVEVVSLLSSSSNQMQQQQQKQQINTTTKSSSLLDPPGESSCAKPFLDPPAASSPKPTTEHTKLLAPMASYLDPIISDDVVVDNNNISHDNNSQRPIVEDGSITVLEC